MHNSKIAIVTPTLGNLNNLYLLVKNLSNINNEIKLKWYIILKQIYSDKRQVANLIEKIRISNMKYIYKVKEVLHKL